MKKYFVSSDIHSFFNEWMDALEKAGFDENNPNHIIITCGDLFDRGPDARKCLNFILKMLNENRAICIRGNHEQLFEDVLNRGYFMDHDYHNKTNDTFHQLAGPSDEWAWGDEEIELVRNKPSMERYLKACVPYYETEKYIFVHGWIPCSVYDPSGCGAMTQYEYDPEWRTYEDYYWRKNACWYNGMDAWNQGVREPGKTIVCGHWHSSWGHSNLHHTLFEDLQDAMFFMTDKELEQVRNRDKKAIQHLKDKYVLSIPFEDEGIIALDACTAYSGRVNVYTISRGMKPIKKPKSQSCTLD